MKTRIDLHSALLTILLFIGAFCSEDGFPQTPPRVAARVGDNAEDGGTIHYDRISPGTGFRDAVFEHVSWNFFRDLIQIAAAFGFGQRDIVTDRVYCQVICKRTR